MIHGFKSSRNSEKRKEIIPPRGVVFDRNNKKIVSNKTYFNLMFKEDDITDPVQLPLLNITVVC